MQIKVIDFHIDQPESKNRGCEQVAEALINGWRIQATHIFSDHGRAVLVFILSAEQENTAALYEEEAEIAQEFTVGQLEPVENGESKFAQIKGGILGVGSKLT